MHVPGGTPRIRSAGARRFAASLERGREAREPQLGDPQAAITIVFTAIAVILACLDQLSPDEAQAPAVIENGGASGGMPPDPLNDQQAQDVAAYVAGAASPRAA